LDDLGDPLAPGSIDTHYVVTKSAITNAEVRSGLSSLYFANDANSQWIWQQSDGQPTNVTLTFRTTFDLTGFDSNNIIINGQWGADNLGIDVLINGVSTGISLPLLTQNNFEQLHSLQIVDGFVPGINTLDFVIEDIGLEAGFRAELVGTTATVVPIPGAIWLFLSAFPLVASASSVAKRGVGFLQMA
jgi:hypothetical protein